MVARGNSVAESVGLYAHALSVRVGSTVLVAEFVAPVPFALPLAEPSSLCTVQPFVLAGEASLALNMHSSLVQELARARGRAREAALALGETMLLTGYGLEGPGVGTLKWNRYLNCGSQRAFVSPVPHNARARPSSAVDGVVTELIPVVRLVIRGDRVLSTRPRCSKLDGTDGGEVSITQGDRWREREHLLRLEWEFVQKSVRVMAY